MAFGCDSCARYAHYDEQCTSTGNAAITDASKKDKGNSKEKIKSG